MRHGFDQFANGRGFVDCRTLLGFRLFDNAAISNHDGPIAHHANDVKIVADKNGCRQRFVGKAIPDI
jgi:hypothetical protein